MALISKRMSLIPESQTMAMSNLARELMASGKDVIMMSTGEPDFETIELASEAGIKAIRNGETRYTAGDGTPALKKAIQHKFQRDNELSYDIKQITVGNGGKQVIYNAMAATLDPGDEVIIPAPFWVSYPVIVAMNGGVPVYLPCSQSDGFTLKPSLLERAITAKTKWLFLNFPNNPSGAIINRDTLEMIAEILRKYPKIHVMTDDIYEYLQFSDEKFYTLAQVAPDLFERVLTVNGMSKSYAMTGWRIGFAGAGNHQLIHAMSVIQSQVTANPCSIAQAAAKEALLEAPSHIAKWRETFIKRRDIVLNALSELSGISATIPQGAFYVFPNVSGMYGRKTPDGTILKSSTDVATFWLKEAGVAVVSGDAFGAEDHVRISYSVDTDKVREAMQRIMHVHSLLV